MNLSKGPMMALMSTVLVGILCVTKCSPIVSAAAPCQGFGMTEVITPQEKVDSVREFLSVAEEFIGRDSPEGRLSREAVNVLYDYFTIEFPDIVIDRIAVTDFK